MPIKDPERSRAYGRKWIQERRAAWFSDKVCARCGTASDLQLDHIDPSSKVDHRIWSWSAPRREAELVKCQALCVQCHRAKTITLDMKRARHGGGWMYSRHGCRCAECSRWKQEDNAKRVR